MEKTVLSREAIKQYRKVNTSMLIFHIVLIIPNLIFSPTHMLLVNLASILFYFFGYKLIEKFKDHIIIYSHAILMEIMIYVLFSVLIYGWECGFQYWLFAILCTFFKDYATPKKENIEKDTYLKILVITVFSEFIILHFVSKYVEIAIADHPTETISSVMLVVNSFMAFSAVALFTRFYTKQMEIKYFNLHNKAEFDQLTGLPNRYYITEMLHNETDVAGMEKDYSVAMLDIDYFKNINDTYGHDNGDIVLRDIARILSRYTSDTVKASRWGGEEFLIVACCTMNYLEFQAMLEQIRKEIEAYKFVLNNDCTVNCTVSIGAAHYFRGLKAGDIIKGADNNLYMAKNTGRNRLIA